MGPSAPAFATALGLTLIGVPLLRRLALATDFVDRPAARKSHHEPVPYLGGVALITSVLVAILLERRLPWQVGGLILGAALIGTMGLVDDDRSLDPRLRFLAELGAAAAVICLDLRIHATGMIAIDVVVTLVWIVGVTNAMNLLDNMDGLAAGVTAAAAAALFFLAGSPDNAVTSTVAAALVGACLGFLVYNRRPAKVFMGDTGSLFLGFVLAVLTVDIDPALPPPRSFAIPVILLFLPILDTTTVTLARLRRGRPVSQGGKDHLSHRLVARGLSPGKAVLVLIAVEAVLGSLAVLAGRGVLSLVWAGAAAIVVLAALSSVTLPAKVYTEPVVGLPRKVTGALAAGALALLALAAPALIALAMADRPARSGAAALNRALASVGTAEPATLLAQVRAAGQDLQRARARLDSPIASVSLLIPGISSNLRAARTVTETGVAVAQQAAGLAALAEARQVAVDLRAPPVAEATRLARPLEGAAAAVKLAKDRLLKAASRPYLAPSLERTVTDLYQRVIAAEPELERAALLTRLVPALVGHEGPRRYLVGYQDGRELRATGGSITVWADLDATNGVLRLGALHTDDETWTGLKLSPDFPTAAGTMRAQYERAAGRHLDGIVLVDAKGLARLQALVGQPATENPGADAVASAWSAVFSSPLGSAASVAQALSEAAREGHLLLALSEPDEQRLAARLGIDGSLPPANEDSLLVLNETAPGSGAGADLRRVVRYQVELTPSLETATVSGTVEVTLASARGVPNTDVSVLSPFPARSATIDGEDSTVVGGEHLGRQVGSVSVDVPAGGTRTVRMKVAGEVRLAPGGWYGLEIVRQPALVPEQVDVSIHVPSGWRIAERRGLEREGGRIASGTLNGERRQAVWVRLERSGWSRIWQPSPAAG